MYPILDRSLLGHCVMPTAIELLHVGELSDSVSVPYIVFKCATLGSPKNELATPNASLRFALIEVAVICESHGHHSQPLHMSQNSVD